MKISINRRRSALEIAVLFAWLTCSILTKAQATPLTVLAEDPRSSESPGDSPTESPDTEDADIPFSISVDEERIVESDSLLKQGETGRPVDYHTAPSVEPEKEPESERETEVREKLSVVDIQVKFDGLGVKPLLNVMATPFQETYDAGEPVKFRTFANYPAFIQRSEIRIFEKDALLKAEPVAVLPVTINGETEWVIPEAENEEKPHFKYLLRVYDFQGRYDETVPRAITRKEPLNRGEPEEKKTGTPTPAIDEDRTGSRDIQIYGGAVTVAGRNVPEGYQISAMEETISRNPQGAFVVQRILPPGGHQVSVTVSHPTKESTLDFSREINIPQDDWFYVGLADLTMGKRYSPSQEIEAVRPGEYEHLYSDGRVAFYVKGKIKGQYLLTAAADTQEGNPKKLTRGTSPSSPRELLRRIDPDRYYPVYGDDSVSIEDAPTDGQLYIRLERGNSTVMWGNYRAQIRGTEFMRSERALYGASAVHRSENTTSFGERETEVSLYAAQPQTLPQRDEFLGTGGSIYFLKRQDVVVGTEFVTVEYRDQTTGLVLERRPLAYSEDYNIDYFQGRLLLRKPLPSSTTTSAPVRDGALGGSRIYLVVEYEYAPPVESIDGYAYGGRIQHWLGEKVRLGVTGMRENADLLDQKAYGADIKFRHSENTFLEAEIAHSKGPGFSHSSSTDGGLTIRHTPIMAKNQDDIAATAGRLRGQIDLGDLPNSETEGLIGGYYERKGAGFSTFSEQVTAKRRLWGLQASADLNAGIGLKLTYDDFNEDWQPGYDSSFGGRSKRKGEAAVSKDINEYWKASLGLSYTELRSPISSLSGKPGYDGERVDTGLRLQYRPDPDHSYYAFGQRTLAYSGDIVRGNRLGVGTKYQFLENIALEGEISYGSTGLGAIAGATYSSAAGNSYYAGYRLDPDRAFDPSRLYDLSGPDHGALAIGARQKFDDSFSVYAENNYDLFGRRHAISRIYGITYTPSQTWTFGGGIEAGTIEDDTIDSRTGLEPSDFNRRALSLSAGYTDENRGISGRARGEARIDRSDDETRNLNTYLAAAGLSVKTSQDWRILLNLEAVLSHQNSEGNRAFHHGNYVETTLGYAYRPVSDDRLNALLKYSAVYEAPGFDQISAITGDRDSPAQRSHILSADANYNLLPSLSIGTKYGVRLGEIKDAGPPNKDNNGWEKSTAHLFILRTDWQILKRWDILGEFRALYMPEAKTTDYGTLFGVYRQLGKHMKVGAGYNFGKFSDDLRDLTLDDEGFILNIIGQI